MMQCVAILQNLSRSDPSSLRLIMSGKFTVCKLSHSAISNLFKRYLQNVKVVNSPASTYSVCDNGVLTMSNLVIDNCIDDFIQLSFCNLTISSSRGCPKSSKRRTSSRYIFMDTRLWIYVFKLLLSGHNTDGFDVRANNITIEKWFVNLIPCLWRRLNPIKPQQSP